MIAHDNLYVGEVGGFRVRKVDAQTGIVTTLAGTGIPGWGEEGTPDLKRNAIPSNPASGLIPMALCSTAILRDVYAGLTHKLAS